MIICSAVKPASCECWGWREMLNSSILGHGKSPRLQMLRIGKPWLNAQDRDSTHQAIESTEEFGGSRRIALLLFIRLCRMTLPARNSGCTEPYP